MYSNCLIEAIKAKIRNPSSVKIHIISPKLNNGLFHMYWIENGKVFHYSDPKNNGNLLSTLLHPLFNGIIKNPDTEIFANMLVRKMCKAGYTLERIKKVFSKLHIDYDEEAAFEKEKRNIKIVGNLDIPIRKKN